MQRWRERRTMEIDASRHRQGSGCYSRTSQSSVEMCQRIGAEQRMSSPLVRHFLSRASALLCFHLRQREGGQCSWIEGSFQRSGSYESSDRLLSRARHQSSLAVTSLCVCASVFVLRLHIRSVGDVSDRLQLRLTNLFVFAQGRRTNPGRLLPAEAGLKCDLSSHHETLF